MVVRPAKELNDEVASNPAQLMSAMAEAPAADGPSEFVINHLEIARVIERAHRRFLDLLRIELTRLGTDDISPSQVMLLFTIGSDELSVRDLLERGHYLGSNASYNLKQLVEGGYVHRSPSLRDRRSARLRLTAKAVSLCEAIRSMHETADRAPRDDAEAMELSVAYNVLRRLEMHWTSALRYGGEGG